MSHSEFEVIPGRVKGEWLAIGPYRCQPGAPHSVEVRRCGQVETAFIGRSRFEALYRCQRHYAVLAADLEMKRLHNPLMARWWWAGFVLGLLAVIVAAGWLWWG